MTNKKLPNKRFESIDEIYAFIVEEDGGEGVMGMLHNGTWLPFIGADMDRVESLKPVADNLAKVSGIKYEIRKFKKIVKKESEHITTGHMKEYCRMKVIVDVGTNVEGINVDDMKNNLIGQLIEFENKLNSGNARYHFKDPVFIRKGKKR